MQRMLILAADLHIRPNGASRERFRDFLQWVSSTPHDIAFLGDVLDLWIGVDAYSDELSREFLAWCRSEKERRGIYLVEGNHEYFVARHHGEAFTEAVPEELRLGNLLLLHGDTCQHNPSHLRFRWWVKSRLAHLLLHFPGAAAYVRHLKNKLERKSRARRHSFPQAELSAFASERFCGDNPPQSIVLGNFHHNFLEQRRGGRTFAVLPAWKTRGEIALWNPEENQLSVKPWTHFAATAEKRPLHKSQTNHKDKQP